MNVTIVAEISTSHLGDCFRLQELILHAKRAGADAIKLQKRTVDLLYSSDELAKQYRSPFGGTLFDYRTGVELDEQGFIMVSELCQKLSLKWFVSVLDFPAFQFVEQFNPSGIKVPSTISNHKNFLEKLSKSYRGPIIVSTGMSEQKYVDYVIEKFHNNSQLIIAHCISAYPAPSNSCNIAYVRTLLKLIDGFDNISVGYSSHDHGSLASMLAVAAGATYIEKHIKLGNTSWNHFDHVCIDVGGTEFFSFVQDIREAQNICGSELKLMHDSEFHKYIPNVNHN